MLNKLRRKDSFGVGIFIGTFFPVIAWVVFHFLNIWIAQLFDKEKLMNEGNVILIAFFVNMFLLRFYLKKAKFDQTGRGILFITFIYAMIYFGLYFADKLPWQV